VGEDVDRAAVAAAVEVLRAGGLVAVPTETVYGLAADATSVDALHRLYATKGRPADHPVIVHIAPRRLDEWAVDVPAVARRLADACWPGPLTLVLRRSARVPDAVTGGRATVGLRVPEHPLTLALLEAFGGGIAAPSANRFGRVSPTTAAAVRDELGDVVDLVLDGGPCTVGVESTIVDCTGDEPRVLREGGVTAAELEVVVGRPVRVGGTTAAPGTLPQHYAPRARVELLAATDLAARAEVLLAAGERVGALALHSDLPDALPDIVTLATPRDAREYARHLYASLRGADAMGLDVVLAVAPAPEGIGAAVADRLRRAAASR
jgi:L-threonylcarbamoyladenylate synthase